MGGSGDMMTAAAITSRKSDIIAGTRDIQEPARKGREQEHCLVNRLGGQNQELGIQLLS